LCTRRLPPPFFPPSVADVAFFVPAQGPSKPHTRLRRVFLDPILSLLPLRRSETHPLSPRVRVPPFFEEYRCRTPTVLGVVRFFSFSSSLRSNPPPETLQHRKVSSRNPLMRHSPRPSAVKPPLPYTRSPSPPNKTSDPPTPAATLHPLSHGSLPSLRSRE